MREISVPEGLDGERLDAAVARMFGLSRSRAAELIGDGLVLVGGRAGAKSDRVLTGDDLIVTLPAPRAPEPPVAVDGMVVVFEDDDIIVVDKPRGVAAHPSPGWTGPTVIGGLLAAGHTVATSGAAERQGIVHRLDANTSGVMVVAKSERAYSALKQAFRERTVDKTYHALVQGHPDPLRGTVDEPIGRHPSGDGRFAVISGGRPSVTHYDTLEAFRGASLVSVKLETGRTHQIRVHMSALRHPCVGDLLYGADPTLAARLGLTRQWLHAVQLSFEHPTSGQVVTFTSPYPADLQHGLDLLAAQGLGDERREPVGPRAGQELDHLVVRDPLAGERVFRDHCVDLGAAGRPGQDQPAGARLPPPRDDEAAGRVVAREVCLVPVDQPVNLFERAYVRQHQHEHRRPP
jgi:23S rRNA pseudouridine1911/1915/1917 synthase